MTATLSPHAPETSTSTRTRWWVLVVLALTQLVVVLDGTIVNIALPAGADGARPLRRRAPVGRHAYALAFGALLLLGGRIADYWGRKRTFLVGMVGFGARLRPSAASPRAAPSSSSPAACRACSPR